jgi:hypothetical protein
VICFSQGHDQEKNDELPQRIPVHAARNTSAKLLTAIPLVKGTGQYLSNKVAIPVKFVQWS